MPRGRRPGPGTAEEKAAIRREKVRLNVQAYRKRKQAAEKGDSVPLQSSLKWVEDTKWQSEYEQQRRNSDQSDVGDDAQSEPPESITTDEGVGEVEHVENALIVTTPQFNITPDIGKQNTLAILGMFPERFLPSQLSLPNFEDIQTLRTPCALWVTTATKQARSQDAGALNDVLHSIVLAVMGMENQRPDLQVHAQQLYTRSLNKTRRLLGPILANARTPTHKESLQLFLSCHAAAVYELLVNGSMSDMLRHVKGIGLLIEHTRRMPNFPEGPGNSLIEEYRMMEIHFCLQERVLSTTARMNKLTTATPHVSHRETIVDPNLGLIGTLLDLADQILPIMVELDSYTPSNPANAGQLMKLVQLALSLHSQLDSWSTFLRTHSFPASPCSDSSSDSSEPVDLAQISQYEFASCYLFSLTYDLHALEVCIETVNALARRTSHGAALKPSAQSQLLRTKSLCVAGYILELMPYFFQNDKGIIGRSIAIWPLEAVWRMLDTESQRLLEDEQVCTFMNVSDDFRNKIRSNKEMVERYYAMCRRTGRAAHSYGLPLLEERPTEEPGGVGMSRVQSIDSGIAV